MQPFIKRRNASLSYFTEELCSINELSNTPLDAAVSIAEATVAPGITTRWHVLHGIVERYVIQSGNGLVEVGDLAPQHIGPGAVVVIPAGCRQRITNNSSTPLVFLAICSPRFEQRFYQDVDAQQ